MIPIKSLHVNCSVRLHDEVKQLWDLETSGIRSTDEVHDELLDNVS